MHGRRWRQAENVQRKSSPGPKGSRRRQRWARGGDDDGPVAATMTGSGRRRCARGWRQRCAQGVNDGEEDWIGGGGDGDVLGATVTGSGMAVTTRRTGSGAATTRTGSGGGGEQWESFGGNFDNSRLYGKTLCPGWWPQPGPIPRFRPG